MQVKEQHSELDLEQQSFKMGKEYAKAIYCHPAYIMCNARLDEAQVGIKIAGRYADDSTLIAESEEELKSFLMRVKEENEKAGLKLNIQKTKIMASGHITSRQIDGETMGTVTDFILGGSKIIAMVIAAMKLKDAYSLEGKLWPT